MYIGFMQSTRHSCPVASELEISRQFFFLKNAQIQNFMKIRPVEAKLFHADRGTDVHNEANCHFSQFC